VQLGTETSRPAKSCIRVNESGAVGWIGIVGCFGRNREAPNRTFPWTVRVGIVDLVDTPVIGCAGNKTIGKWKSSEAGNKRCRALVAPECGLGSIVYTVEIVAQIDIVGNSKFSRRPRKVHPRVGNH